MGLLSRLLGLGRRAAPDIEDIARMTPPPREIASNGMTIRPSEPFRNSLRGGSDDLAEAAAMRTQSPDAGGGSAGNAYLDDLRAQGFDVEMPLYHGTGTDFEAFQNGPEGATFLTSDPALANVYARRDTGGDNVRPVFIRPGRVLTFHDTEVPQPSTNAARLAQARREGYDSVRTIIDTRGNTDRIVEMVRARYPNEPAEAIRARLGPRNEGVKTEWAILNPESIVSRFGRPAAPDVGSTGGLLSRARDQLPMDEASRMARARDMGFDMDAPLYHGTDQNIEAFRANDGWFGSGVYASRSPQQAEYYTRRTAAQASGGQEPAPNIMPLVARGNLAPLDEFYALLRENMPRGKWTKAGEDNAARKAQEELVRRGYAGIDAGGLDEEVIIFDPSNVRSRFAAFNPARSGESNLLAGTAIAAPVVGGGLLSRARERRNAGA